MRTVQVLAGLAAAALVAWGCGANNSYSSGPPGGTTTGSSGLTVTMSNMRFSPSTLAIATGQTVTWHNSDSIDHTVTAGTPGTPTGKFDQVLHPNESFTFTFSEAGVVKYFCRYHAANGMVGEVDVGAASSSSGTTGQSTNAGTGY